MKLTITTAVVVWSTTLLNNWKITRMLDTYQQNFNTINHNHSNKSFCCDLISSSTPSSAKLQLVLLSSSKTSINFLCWTTARGSWETKSYQVNNRTKIEVSLVLWKETSLVKVINRRIKNYIFSWKDKNWKSELSTLLVNWNIWCFEQRFKTYLNLLNLFIT